MKTKLPAIVDIETPQFKTWFDGYQKKVNDHYNQDFPSLEKPKFEARQGGRYIKIIQGNSVTTFIDRTNGDVLKSASANAPAKHARGNIFHDDNGLTCMTNYGPCYLR